MSRKFNHAILRIKNSEGRYDALSALRGQNSYELAVRYGFTGTEEEWMESIIGDGWIGAFQDLDDRFADLVAQVEAAHADGAIGTSQYADSSVTRAKLAADALYSPVRRPTTPSYDISASDVGYTIIDVYNLRNSALTWNMSQAVADAFPIGTEIAFLRSYNSVGITLNFTGLRIVNSETGQVGSASKTLSFSLPDRGSMCAIKKLENDSTYGSFWILTGNVEVVS